MAVAGIDNKVLVQVCIIVRDVEKTAARYAEIFGFDFSWGFQTTMLNDHTHAKYYGAPTDARAKLSGASIGSIQFELLQPLDEPSAWMDYRKQHCEGIHHIAFFVPKTEITAASFVEHGYRITHQGLFTGQGGMYTYLDTDRDLGIVIELLEHFEGSPHLSAPPFPVDKGIGTDIVCQVGLIVSNMERTSQRIMDVLGLPAPDMFSTQGYAQSKTIYKGQASEATAKLAFFKLGQIQLELIEPDKKPSVWRDFLETRGEGAHHIAFPIKDTRRVTDYLAQHDIPVAQQGLYADGSGIYTYMGSENALGTMIELLENF